MLKHALAVCIPFVLATPVFWVSGVPSVLAQEQTVSETDDDQRKTPEITQMAVTRLPKVNDLNRLLHRTDLTLSLPGADPNPPDWLDGTENVPFAATDFLASRTPPEHNAAPVYMQGLAAVSSAMGFILPKGEQEAHGQQVGEINAYIKSVTDVERLKRGEVSSGDLRELLAMVQPALRKIDEAQEIDRCLFVTGLKYDSKLYHAEASRQVARLGLVEMYLSSSIESLDFGPIEQAITRVFRLSRDLRPRSPIIGQLVTVAMENNICKGLTSFVLPHAELTPEHCDRLLDLVAKHNTEAVDGYLEGLRIEYFITGNVLSDLSAGRIQPGDIGLDNWPGSMINYEQEWKTANQVFGHLLRTWLEQSKHEFVNASPVQDKMNGVWKRAVDEFSSARSQQRVLKEPVVCAVLLPYYEETREAYIRHNARLGAIQALIAVRRYELLHRMLPDSLQQAVRDAGLESVPTDPYSGGPLKYDIIDGVATVYSVGIDQQDDGGRIDWQFGEQPGDFIFRLEK